MKTRCYIKSRGKSKSSEYSSLGLGPDLLDLHEKLEEAEVKRSTQLHSDKSFMQRPFLFCFRAVGYLNPGDLVPVPSYFKLWQKQHLLTKSPWRTVHCFTSLLEEGFQR